MEQWTTARIVAASRTIDEAWLPPSAEVVTTEDWLVVCRPEGLTSSGSSRVQATIKSPRPFEEMRPEVERLARDWGAEEVQWRTGGDTDEGTSEALRRAGAALVLTELVLARELGGVDVAGLADDNRPGVSTGLVTDRETFDSFAAVESAGWDWPRPSADRLDEQWARLRADLDSSVDFALLATAAGRPASVARFALRDSIARFYGAVTLPAFRGRGLYRALLDARCQLARADGASLALTKGRLETSAPILQRAGFRRCGVEHCWRLPLGRD